MLHNASYFKGLVYKKSLFTSYGEKICFPYKNELVSTCIGVPPWPATPRGSRYGHEPSLLVILIGAIVGVTAITVVVSFAIFLDSAVRVAAIIVALVHVGAITGLAGFPAGSASGLFGLLAKFFLKNGNNGEN